MARAKLPKRFNGRKSRIPKRQCGACSNTFEIIYPKKRACSKKCQRRIWRRANPEEYARRRRNGALRRAFGITLAQYDLLLKQQNGKCAICQSAPGKRKLAVDHCHRTFAIRGLLCISCNVLLGVAKDIPERLRVAALYL